MQTAQPPGTLPLLNWAALKLDRALDLLDEIVTELDTYRQDGLAASVLQDYHSVETTRRIVRAAAAELRGA
jgi:hypothetical protein